jgi:hypothetical protein
MSAVVADARDTLTAAQRAHRRSVLFLRWLRAIHLYVGLWGAGMGLLFGATGLLMNHRAVLKIPVEKVVQKSAQLKLPEQRFEQAQDMAQWLQAELRFEGVQARIKADAPKRITWADQQVEQPARWTFNWQAPHKAVNAEYYVGNRFVKVETQDATPLGTLMRLHMATGVGVFWVLLSDTIAGGLVVLCITGLLLWSRLRPVRLGAACVSVTALLGSAWYLWSVSY